MATARAEKAYERHLWMVFFAIGLIIFVFGALLILAGIRLISPDPIIPTQVVSGGKSWEQLSADPATERYIRNVLGGLGTYLVGYGIFAMAISAGGYRTGQRWAWYALWYVPANAVVVIATGYGALVLWVIFLILSLVALLLPYRSFFPRGEVARA